jgi:tryptophan synthase alpha chain
MVRRLRPHTKLGLVAMVSQSIIDRIGVEAFVQDAADAGIDGLIVPDIDTAMAPVVRERADAHRMTFSLLVAPTTPDERIAELTALSSGFVYVLARAGITGERTELPDVERVVERVRRHTDLPLAVGFGISTPEQVATVTGCADAAIVGSALVRRMRDAADPVAAAKAFTAELAGGLRAQVG